MTGSRRVIEGWLDRLDGALDGNCKWLVALAAIAFVVKAVYVFQSADSLDIRVPIMDAKYYDKTARDILAGHVIRREAFFMGPLYSYFLAAVYGVFGRDFTVARLIQAAGGSATVLVTYFLGRRLFRPSIGLVGAVLMLLYGATTFYETQLLMMWLGTLLNVSMLLLLVRIEPDARWRAYVAPGILLGVSALARATVLAFLPAAVLWIVAVRPVPGRWKKAAVLAAATVVAVLPATIHNYVASRDFVPVTSNAGINFYIGNSAQATGIFYPPPGTDFVTDSTTRSYVERLVGRDMSPSEVSGYWFDKAFAFIRSNPRAELKLLARKLAMFFNAYEIPQIESYDLSRRRFQTLRVLFVDFRLIGALGILGMLLSLSQWRRLFPLHSFVVVYALAIAAFFVTARYRVQVAPLMALFAAFSLLDALPRHLSSLRRGAAVVGLAAVILVVTQPGLFALDPKDVDYREHVHLARRASMAGEYRAAVAEIDSALSLYPDYYEGYVHRAIIHKEARNYFKAIEDYTRALDLRPDLPNTHYDLGQTLRRVNMKRKAIEEYQKAIELDPLMIKAHNNLGITYAEVGEYQRAVDEFEKVIAMDPNYVKAYNNLGAVLAQNDRVDDAIAAFQEAVRRDPSYPSSYKNLANAYAAKKQVRPAIEALSRYLELVPEDAGARADLEKLRVAASFDSSAAPPAGEEERAPR